MKALQKELQTGKFEVTDSGLILPKSKVSIGGVFTTTVNDEDPQPSPNIVVNEGLVYVLNTALSAVSQEASWFIGIFKNNYTPVPADTAATFVLVGSSDEANAEYDEATRPAYTVNTSNLANVSNSSSPAAFTMNTAQDIYGAFLVSTATKSGTLGVLCAASKFSAVRSLVSSDVLNITYQITIADA